MRGELEALARERGVEANVVLVGNRDQRWVANALSSADVVFSPVTGRSLVEAALSGTPIVAYDFDWQTEMIRSGETGVLVPYRDLARTVEAIVALLDDRELAVSLGADARRWAMQRMDPDALNAHEKTQYVRVIGGDAAGSADTYES
jgi:glycosyltransferase involved in cell wall biosynthesis